MFVVYDSWYYPGNIFVVVICDLDEKMHLLVVGDIKY